MHENLMPGGVGRGCEAAGQSLRPKKLELRPVVCPSADADGARRR